MTSSAADSTISGSLLVAASLVATSMLATGGCVTSFEAADPNGGQVAPLLTGMGAHTHPVTTTVPEAQRFFDQGLILHYAFNHAEALRSFRESSRLDPDCAMCFWGEALTLGPNVNALMPDDAVAPAWTAIQRAQHLAPSTSSAEQALIAALATRYGPPSVGEREQLDSAYAVAMREVVDLYPNDSDAATLWAEALMATTPWDYWAEDGQPRVGTSDVLGILQRAIDTDPGNPGAHHFYIHAVEAMVPELALDSAVALATLVPGAGHLVHMPAHIYLRLGRYHEATLANEQAMEADASYAAQSQEQGLYPTLYMPHNPHFLVYTASMEGRSAFALQTARDMAARIERDGDLNSGVGTVQHYWVTPIYTMARFGMWAEILDEAEPAEALPYPRAVWHYARGLALANTGAGSDAQAELAALKRVASEPAINDITVWDMNAAGNLLQIAEHVLAGAIAENSDELEAALAHYVAAVEIQDTLNYDEPPPWHFPVRQAVGNIELAAGRYVEAEAAFRADLEEFPNNGWSLWGLWRTLTAAGNVDQAQQMKTRFDAAWAGADHQLPGN